MNDLAGALPNWLAAASVQAIVPLLGAMLLDRLLPRAAWPELRAAAWSLALLWLALPGSVATQCNLLPWQVPVPDALATAAMPRAIPTAMLPRLSLVWALGALAVAATTLLRHRRHVAGLLAHTAPLPRDLARELRDCGAALRMRRLPIVAFAPAAHSSCAIGWLRPRLVLAGRQLEALDATARRHVLLHELAHVRRRDLSCAAACELLRALFWFHPLVWLATRRLHALRELCCDQTVVRTLGGDPSAYRSTVLAAAALLLQGHAPQRHAFAPAGCTVLQRLAALERRRGVGGGAQRAATAACALLFAVACAPFAAATVTNAARQIDALPADLRGCMQRQWLVLAALARAEADGTASTENPSR